MATKKSSGEVAVDQECLAVLRELYSRYTGYQIAACVAQIRREIDAQRQQEAIEAEISALKLKLTPRI